MSLNFRRLLNHLPSLPGPEELSMPPTWHKPSPYDQWRSQPPFRPVNSLRADHFGRSLRRRRLGRGLLRVTLILAAAWIVIESVQALGAL